MRYNISPTPSNTPSNTPSYTPSGTACPTPTPSITPSVTSTQEPICPEQLILSQSIPNQFSAFTGTYDRLYSWSGGNFNYVYYSNPSNIWVFDTTDINGNYGVAYGRFDGTNYYTIYGVVSSLSILSTYDGTSRTDNYAVGLLPLGSTPLIDLTLTTVGNVRYPIGTGSQSFYIAYPELCPTPTQTSSPTLTPGFTQTQTNTPTVTPSQTATPSVTNTQTATPSATPTLTPTTTSSGATLYCYVGIWEVDDPLHPSGGTVNYIDQFGSPQTITGVWLDEYIQFLALEITFITGLATTTCLSPTPSATPTLTPTTTTTNTPSGTPPCVNTIYTHGAVLGTCSDFCNTNYLIQTIDCATQPYGSLTIGDFIYGYSGQSGYIAYSNVSTDTNTGPFRIADIDGTGEILGIYVCSGGSCLPL